MSPSRLRRAFSARLLASALMVVAAGSAIGCAGHADPSTVPSPDAVSAPRLFVFALDAVPYEAVEAMMREGAFSGFAPPDRLVSTFPSATTLAISDILSPLGLERPEGYEARYFDRASNRIRGGGLFSYNRVKFHWRTAWDWKAGNVRKIVSGLRPVHASLSAVDDALEAFAASDDPVFLAYTDATDLAGHLKSPDSLARILEHLDVGVAALRRSEPDRPFHVLLFSDHGQAGGQPLLNVRAPVRRALRDAGFRLRSRFGSDDADGKAGGEAEKEIVLVPFGLLSTVVAYTRPALAHEAARAVAAVEGVDFCVASDGTPDEWRVQNRDGGALIERRRRDGDVEWRYRVDDADPLVLAELMGDAARWRADDWLRRRTEDHVYPDPLHRIAGGFDAVGNPASMLCSLETRAMFGALLTSVSSRLSVGRLKWTHGTLHRAASMGFLLTDLPGWNGGGQIRADAALIRIAEYARDVHGLEPVIAPRAGSE